jgi:hypothetical protein
VREARFIARIGADGKGGSVIAPCSVDAVVPQLCLRADRKGNNEKLDSSKVRCNLCMYI